MIQQMSFELLLGLIAFHRHGVVHCNMMPTNIGILKERLVALDLGLAEAGAPHGERLVQGTDVMGAHGFQLLFCS